MKSFINPLQEMRDTDNECESTSISNIKIANNNFESTSHSNSPITMPFHLKFDFFFVISPFENSSENNN